MHITRKNIARFLFAAASVAVLGVCGYFYGLELLAKWAFAHRDYFAADELILISVPKSALTSETAHLLHDGEFEWKGEMVDVLHREVLSDTLFVYGFRDKAETQLRKEAAWLYKDAHHPYRRSNTRTKRVKWVSLINPILRSYFDSQAALKLFSIQSFFSYLAAPVTAPLLEVPYPPPNS
ncbi:hypothetical protein [Spirosoma fluviale]|uniref:Uncharacterized protein n=1 Tax=Spirosoma fluviale TaxID=1597977 RepID=A0A286FBJ8_9BACT|nr:hypothetical protein [Spirosoma fluviale]SOD80605.1 hypothetical protein SAMN06269250_1486 [Spirosoma fluviale]